jgi:hypothetical protein
MLCKYIDTDANDVDYASTKTAIADLKRSTLSSNPASFPRLMPLALSIDRVQKVK